MAKYIIDIASPNVRNEYIVYWTYDGLEAKRVSDLTPYTDPDLEQVRKEGYEKGWKEAEDNYFEGYSGGYDAGLDDAWKAARKIWEYDTTTLREIFGEGIMRMDWFMELTASEAIKKIWQYEQKQEEIKVGDEVENTQTGVKFIVTHLWENNRGEQGVSGFNQECSAFSTTLSLVVKTGRTFPEIASVLEKMQGEQDDKRREE